ICNKDLAKKTQNDITPANILKNSEKLDNLELKDNFDILATYYDEQNVCMIPEEDEINTNIFDRANFALIMIVDYIQGFFKMRKLRNKIPPPDPQRPNEQDPRYITDLNSYFLGQQFSFNAGQTGLPVYFSDGKIEIAYRYNADIENSLELATLI
ncbi:7871_t:CDS:2, partial [Ambispora leptoticha]